MGICLSKYDLEDYDEEQEPQFESHNIRKIPRSEQEIDTISPYINTPIRIHKYNLDEEIESQEDSSSDDISTENDQESIEQYSESNEQQYPINDPLNALLNIQKRPTLAYLPYDPESNERINFKTNKKISYSKMNMTMMRIITIITI